MPELNLEALRAAAEGATLGPWMPFQERGVNEILIEGTDISVVHWQGFDAASTEPEQKHHDCAFIALANPATILQLIARLEASERDGERLDFVISHFRCDPKMDGKHIWYQSHFKKQLSGPDMRSAIDAQIAARKE